MEIVDEHKHMKTFHDLTRSEGMATVGVANFVRRVVTTTKPRLAVEQRSETGFTFALAQGLNDNGFGRLIACDRDEARSAQISKEIASVGFSSSILVDVRSQSATESKFEGSVDLLVCSVDHEQVVRRLLQQINPFGIVLLHAGKGDFAALREFALDLDKEGVVSVVLLPATLKLVLAQRRGGRK